MPCKGGKNDMKECHVKVTLIANRKMRHVKAT